MKNKQRLPIDIKYIVAFFGNMVLFFALLGFVYFVSFIFSLIVKIIF